MEDIYYIETLKSTHYCQIKYKEGVGKIRADITPLAFDTRLLYDNETP